MIQLRVALPEDALCLSVLAMQVFLDTYATQGIRPEIAREVLSTYSQAEFVGAIAHAGTCILVAERAGHLLGFAQITLGATQELAPSGVQAELLRLYVQEPFTGAQLGTALLAKAEAIAAQAGATVLWLTPWVHNHRAIAFYGKRGFEDVGQTWFTFEGEAHENRVFAKILTASELVHAATQPTDWRLRPAETTDARAVAQVLLASRKALMPYAPWAHSDAELTDWVKDVLVAREQVTVAELGGCVLGVLAVSQDAGIGWIDQLYIDPMHVGQGAGTLLLNHALATLPRPVRLYTFQQNDKALRFYAAHGFVTISQTDGAENEEACPDALLELAGNRARP